MANTIDGPRSQLDRTVRIFDQFYNFDLVVNASEYDVVYSYFYDVSNSKTVAKNFTTMLFRISNVTGEKIADLLEYIQGSSKMEVSALLAYYLNSIKSKTTLYGVSTEPQPNQPVQRNIVV